VTVGRAGRVAVVFGTRPEIVKLAGIARILGDDGYTIHSGQHFTPEMGQLFVDDLELPAPEIRLEIGGTARGQQIGAATSLLDEHFEHCRPAAVVVQGDTNTVLAGALAANAREIPLVHIEAGLRSHDRAMPEEHNRVVADHLSDLCCTPTETSRENLAAEGIEGNRVVVTGNTVVDAVDELLPDRDRRLAVLAEYGIEPNQFAVATFHRPENVDTASTLALILDELASLPVPVVLPLHPRTAARASAAGLHAALAQLVITEPLGYRPFLSLVAESALLVSDSGGLAEEASVVKRPIVIVRTSTERPEVLGTFAELVPPGPGIGALARRWIDDLTSVHKRLAALPTPYGDGRASERCFDAVRRLVEPD